MLRQVAKIRVAAVALLTALSLSVGSTSHAQMTPVLAVVDMDLVVRESNAVRTLEAQLLELQQRWETELTDVNKQLAAQLRTAQEQLNAGDIEQEAFRQVQIQTQRDLQALRQEANARQRKLIQTRRLAEGELRRILEEIVIGLASETGANMVLNFSAVVISAEGFDLSVEALRRLNNDVPELNLTVSEPTAEEIAAETVDTTN
ncbi:MAG: OmpH family outer membrane protein [Alphaproteobacteria bacterium]